MAAADRAWNKRQSFDGRGSFRGWLASLTRNVARNRIPQTRKGGSADAPTRHRRRVREEVPIDAGEGGRHAEFAIEPDQDRKVLLREVADGLDRLEERERLSVTLFFVAGLSDAEIAGVLGAENPRTIPPLRHRALTKLRRRLDVS